MICVTSADRSAADLAERLAEHRRAALQELRLDLLEGEAPALSSLPVEPARLLACLRPAREGGRFTGSEEERLARLQGMIEQGVGWIDIEESTPEPHRSRIIAEGRRRGAKVLISCHEKGSGAVWHATATLERLAAAGGDAVKLAVPVFDVADLAPLQEACMQSRLPAAVVAIGPAGLLSRALYRQLGSFMTYAAARSGSRTAEGQPTLGELQRLGVPVGDTALYVLLGGPQVQRSPGPRVYNALFAERDIPARYFAAPTNRPADAIAWLCGQGLKGCSVTMPLKRRVVGLMDKVADEAVRIGVVNTVSVEGDGSLSGDLTDGRGACAALARRLRELTGKRAVLLGAGATAAAIAQALVAAGMTVRILGRDETAAAMLASKLGAGAGHLRELAAVPFDVLVQTTPVGSDDPEATLVADSRLLAGKVVLDVALTHETRLLRDTRAAGGVGIAGLDLWCEQGRLQLERWLGLRVTAKELARWL